MDTVTLSIDGRQVTVPKGTTVLQAALDHGISIPYYCFHPGIGVEGSCRVCLVKIEKMPKLQTSCSTVCTDGMLVDTSSPEVVDARASVFEFLLLNHPLDCPVCDKGGECPLQDFSYTFGPKNSRMEFPRRTFDGEGVAADVDFGPTLMLNRNRCILCTRCVRFMRDVDADPQIAVIDRGNHSELGTFEERGVHSLLSGNLMDVCPVGAITTRDYRFKSRPWDNPVVVDTICTSCSKGCNTTAWLRAKPEWAQGARLIRITPRFNPDVNGYWMCDIGRFGYHWIEGERRLTAPTLRHDGGQPQAADWKTALDRTAAALTSPSSAVHLLVSAHASTETLFVLRELARFAGPGGATIHVGWTATPKTQPAGTAFVVPSVDAPNVAGARDLGLPIRVHEGSGSSDLSTLESAVTAGSVSTLFVVDPGPAGTLGDLSWIVDARTSGRVRSLVVLAVESSVLTAAADIVLPGAAALESNGLFTNSTGRVQASARVMAPPGEARDSVAVLVDIAGRIATDLGWATVADVRRDLAVSLADTPAYAACDQIVPGGPVPARTWLRVSNPSERWKWDHMFHDNPPSKGEPQVIRADVVNAILKKS